MYAFCKVQSFINFDNHKLLVQDYSITCHQGEHLTFIFIAVGFLLLYIAGIPLIMFMLMWKNRKHLHDETSSRHAIDKFTIGSSHSMCLPRRSLSICKNGTIETLKYCIYDGCANYFKDLWLRR